jgi:putative NADH-flavin reductase
MQTKNKIAVLGSTGKAGIYLIQQLLKLEIPLKLLLRHPENFQINNPLIEIVPGDARNPEKVQSLVEGTIAVISTLGQPRGEDSIFSVATNNVIQAMRYFHIKRYIVCTGLNVDTPQDSKTAYTATATEWMKKNYPKTTADKQVEWELLQVSGLDWTLIRLPMIELTDVKKEIAVRLNDCPGENISATSLAIFLVDQLNDRTYIGSSPFIANRIIDLRS